MVESRVWFNEHTRDLGSLAGWSGEPRDDPPSAEAFCLPLPDCVLADGLSASVTSAMVAFRIVCGDDPREPIARVGAVIPGDGSDEQSTTVAGSVVLSALGDLPGGEHGD